MKEQRTIVGIKEGWSEFTLDDGTVVKVKASVTNAETTGKHDPEGRPEYTFSVVNSFKILSPEALRLSADDGPSSRGLLIQ